MAVVRPETGGHVRLAIGLLSAVEWDRENGAREAQDQYLETCEEPVEDLIRGLVIVCRTALSNLAENSDGRYTCAALLRQMAARSVSWQ